MRRICSAAVAFGVSCIAFFALLLSVGCGGSSSAHLRLLNAIPVQGTIDMVVDNKSVATGVAYATASSYVNVSSGARQIQIQQTGNSLGSANPTLSAKSFTTIVASAQASNGAMVLTDDNSAPGSGNVRVRVINGSVNMGTVDVYVVTAGTDINTVSATYTNVTDPSATGYTTLAAGSYQVFFTLPSTKTVLLSTIPLSFNAGQVRTVAGLDGQSGGLTTAVLSDVN